MKEVMMNLKADCKTCRRYLPDLLLDESFLAERADVAAHLNACAECRAELEALQSTFALLDTWSVPEPSPYFDAKLHARLREVEESAPEGLWHRLRSYLLYSTERGFRPAMAGALAIVLVLGGGGTFLGLYEHPRVQAQISPTVNDLKIMDNNAQTLQQMDQLLDPSVDDASAPPAT
jgi:predicted anti-sigma-YlaC factor YlaD